MFVDQVPSVFATKSTLQKALEKASLAAFGGAGILEGTILVLFLRARTRKEQACWGKELQDASISTCHSSEEHQEWGGGGGGKQQTRTEKKQGQNFHCRLFAHITLSNRFFKSFISLEKQPYSDLQEELKIH